MLKKLRKTLWIILGVLVLLSLFPIGAEAIFLFVMGVLALLAKLTGLAYEEVNIIVYFVLIPLSWAVILDYVIAKHYFLLFSVVVILSVIFTSTDISDLSFDLFDISADFLLSLGEYMFVSVLICVHAIMLVYIVLLYLVENKAKIRIFKRYRFCKHYKHDL